MIHALESLAWGNEVSRGALKKYKLFVWAVAVVSFLSSTLAGEVSGMIELKSKNGVVKQDGEVFLGETDYLPGVDFPLYLKAMVSAMKSQRKVSLGKDGKFTFKEVPENVDLMLGISFTGAIYFVKLNLKAGQQMEVNRLLDLTLTKQDVSLRVVNKSGLQFKSEFASVSYLIQDGDEGWVFSGGKPKNSLIRINGAPHGKYTFFVLNEENEDVPNRVDEKKIEINAELLEPILFEIN